MIQEPGEPREKSNPLNDLMSEVNQVYQDLEKKLTSTHKDRGLVILDPKKSIAFLPKIRSFLDYIEECRERPEIALLSDRDAKLFMSFLDSLTLTVKGYEEIAAKEFARTDIHNGLCQDARNDWNDAIGAADMLEDSDYAASLTTPTITRLRGSMSRPRLSYHDYFAKKYSQAVADIIVGYPTSDQEKIAQYNKLVEEYNSLLDASEMEARDVLRIGERVVVLYEISKE